MQTLWLILFIIGFIGGIWFLSRAMITRDRNDGSKHGGGLDGGDRTGATDHHYYGDHSSGDDL